MTTVKVTKLFAENNAQASSSIGTGINSSVIVWILFGVIVLAFSVFILYQYIKDKLAHKRSKQAALELARDAAVFVRDLTIKINELFVLNREQLEKFVPSIGEYKMSEINQNTKAIIVEILKSPQYRSYLHENPKYGELVTNLIALKDLNANLWDTKAPMVIEFFDKNIQKANDDLKKYQDITIENLYNDEEQLKNEMRNSYEKQFTKNQEG
ncbi:hypothetical protein H9M94_01270 [Mycoplasma sp. Pen4]|uniref:MHJ_0274 family protein n=1 Tax=Mycoplasma sp. Pen4 TaxID=640330 RepID=UPI0016547EC1|nr:hypothetical protein [Mycoplasma sp. Pen4]QNM93888.1 hypothetical protein H9M94_01270 [Mycoplasma sp. Pen4]